MQFSWMDGCKRGTKCSWPRTTPLGIIEFTVFGKATESLPAAQLIPRAR
jgi:hypothetical protein